jgi:hypothetical protein
MHFKKFQAGKPSSLEVQYPSSVPGDGTPLINYFPTLKGQNYYFALYSGFPAKD